MFKKNNSHQVTHPIEKHEGLKHDVFTAYGT
jgi:hypothetical protein